MTTTGPREAAIRAAGAREAIREAREAARAAVTTTGPREAAIRAAGARAAIREAREAARAAATTTGPREAAIRAAGARAAIREAREVTRAAATTTGRGEATRATATAQGPRAVMETGPRAATEQDLREAIRAVREMTRMQGTTEAGLTADARQGPGTGSHPLTLQSRQSQAATARIRMPIRMPDLISATGWRTARRKFRRQEREHLSCLSLRRRSLRRMR